MPTAEGLTVVRNGVSYAYNERNGHPYHQLGTAFDRNMSIDEALDAVGVLNEEVYPVDLVDIETIESGRFELAEGIQAIKSNVFGRMGYATSDYEIMTRREIVELAYELIGIDPEASYLDSIGNIGNHGEVFFAYVRLPDISVDPNGLDDKIERGFAAITSFNGSYSNSIIPSRLRIECRNSLVTVFGARKQNGGISAKHRSNAEANLRRKADEAEAFSKARDIAIIDQAEQLLRVNGDKAIERIIDISWPLKDEMTDRARTRREGPRSLLRAMYESYKDKLGANGWAAVQAFNEYQDFHLPVKQRAGSSVNVDKVRAERAVFPGRVIDAKVKAAELVLTNLAPTSPVPIP